MNINTCLLPTAFRLPVLLQAAHLQRAARIDSLSVPLDVADDALFINHKGGAVGKAVLRVQDSVLLGDRPLEVA